MTPADVLHALVDAGIQARAEGSALVLVPAGNTTIPDDLLGAARHHKWHLLDMLTPVGRCLDCRHLAGSAGPEGLAHCHVGRRGRLASASMPCPDYLPRVPT